jgi:hypothetical protein
VRLTHRRSVVPMRTIDDRLELDICANIIGATSIASLRAYVVTLAEIFRDDPSWPGLAVIAQTRLEMMEEERERDLRHTVFGPFPLTST